MTYVHVLPSNRARRCTAVYTSEPKFRSPAQYDLVLSQFNADEEFRYQPAPNGDTFCNIFLWDVTSAMGVEVPHWVLADGTPAEPGAPGAKETLATYLLNAWLPGPGAKRGWVRVGSDPATARPSAQALADKGFPVIAGWLNPRGVHSHVAMVRPNHFGRLASVPRIAQAGGRSFNDGPLKDGFGAKPVEFWWHD